jgi:type IX secretion system PorP/SprF family membrane protein
MRALRHISLLVFLLMAGISAWTQQHPLYSLYHFNGLVINPAYAGSREALNVTLAGRMQWLGLDRGPATQVLGLHAPTWDNRHGFSLLAQHDRTGFTSNLSFATGYAYRIHFGEHTHLGLGMNIGLNQYSVKLSQVQTWQPGDIAFSEGDFTRWHAIVGAGFYLHSDKWWLGGSVPNLIPNKIYDKYYEPLLSRGARHMFVHTGAVLPLGNNLKLRPSVLLRGAEGAPLGADFSLALIAKESFTLGASLRPSNAFVLFTEIHLTRTLKLGYGYDIDLGPLNAFSGGAHELMLGMEWGGTKQNVETPRKLF